MLQIETSIASTAGSLLVSTAQVHIRIYRAALSLAESMSGSFACPKPPSSISTPAVRPKLLWQSARLTESAQGVIFVDVECSAKAVDAAVNAADSSSGKRLQHQVLQFLEQKQNVKLSGKSARVRISISAWYLCMIEPA